jgi:hypothetical protein
MFLVAVFDKRQNLSIRNLHIVDIISRIIYLQKIVSSTARWSKVEKMGNITFFPFFIYYFEICVKSGEKVRGKIKGKKVIVPKNGSRGKTDTDGCIIKPAK